MTVRVALNGFGRIGRNFFRAARAQGAAIDIVAVNDLGSIETMSKAIKSLADTGMLGGGGDEGELFSGVANPFAGLALGRDDQPTIAGEAPPRPIVDEAEPAGVDQLESSAVLADDHRDPVAGDACRRFDDRDAPPRQAVHQAGLAAVRSANDRYAGKGHGKGREPYGLDARDSSGAFSVVPSKGFSTPASHVTPTT